MTCGDGVQTRIVECRSVADNMLIKDSFCIKNIKMFNKPRTQKFCRAVHCMGEWGNDGWDKVLVIHTIMY